MTEGFERVRAQDVPACARTLADAYGPSGGAARGDRWLLPFYMALLWFVPHHYHRGHTLVIGLRRRNLTSALRTAAAWIPYLVLMIALVWMITYPPLAIPTTAVLVLLAFVLFRAARTMRARRSGHRAQMAPRADWIVFDLGARRATRGPGTMFEVLAFLREHVSAGQTLGAVAHDQRTAKAYGSLGLRPVAPGSLRMTGTLPPQEGRGRV